MVQRRMAKKQWHKLVSDDSGHDYVIPANKVDEWYEWDWDASGWEPPKWATQLSGSGLQFAEWREVYD